MEKTNDNSVSLNKYISSTGKCSRREADKLIAEGRVTINGTIAQLGNRVFEGDKVIVDGKVLKRKIETIYIAYNKPIGVVSTTDSKEKDNIVKHINYPLRLFPIGRLDKASQGLIFLTNDGDIVNKILRAGNRHEKEYVVTLKQNIDNNFISKMGNGIPILGTVTKKCKVSALGKNSFKIILTQGLNRQIRRMCEYLGYDVIALKRTRIMNVTLSGLKIGQWRPLSEKEMLQIQKMIAGSSKTEEASVDKQKIKRKNPTKKTASSDRTHRKK